MQKKPPEENCYPEKYGILWIVCDANMDYRMTLFIIDSKETPLMTYTELMLSNWRGLTVAAINREGFLSVSDFLADFPTSSYESLMEKLGFEPTEDNAQYLEILHREDAIRKKQRKHAIMDVLVRYINRDQVRWDKKFESVDKRVGKTYYGWYHFVGSCIKNESPTVKGQKAKQVWDTLEFLTAGQPDWCPKSVDDPYIVKAFENIDW